MSLPFLPLPHRLRPGDVLPVQLVNRLGERLYDAHEMFSLQHRPFDPDGGTHLPIGQPIASRLYAKPSSIVTQYDYMRWAEAVPVWSYGPWDGDAEWQFTARGALIYGRVAGLSRNVVYRGRVLVEIDPASGVEGSLLFGAHWQPGIKSFGYTIPLNVLVAARTICFQVF